MVEVHSQVHEPGGGEVARVAVDLMKVLLDADEPAVLRQVAVDRGPRGRIEVAGDDERLALGVALDEGGERLRLL